MPALESLSDADKLAWARSAGGIRLAGDSLTDVPYVDVDLPTDYDMIQLNIMNWVTETGENQSKDYLPAFAFSSDGGTTWIDATDSYNLQTSEGGHYDTLGLFTYQGDTVDYLTMTCNIFPGTDILPAGLFGDAGAGYTTGLFIETNSCSLRNNLVMVNKLRLKMYGDGTSTPTINIPLIKFSLVGYAA